MARRAGLGLASLLFVPALGCAPSRLAEGIAYAADRYHVRDASTLRVSGKGHLRLNVALRSDLKDAIAESELAVVKERGGDVLRRANALAVTAVAGEVDRMPGEGLRFLTAKYGLTEAPRDVAERREYLKREFAARSHASLDRDLTHLTAAKDTRAARRFLESIADKIEPPAGDRGKLARALLGAPLFLPASIGAEMADREAMQREVVADFQQVVEYRPAQMDAVASAVRLEQADPPALARWFAPLFVQQADPEATYPPSEDRIGRVYLTGQADAIQVHIDIDDPVVYWTHQRAKVGDRRYDQLVYVAWFPSRPALTPNDPEAGRIDGVVVRITLDRHNRPAVYEFVRSCGCYHTLWVAEFVESAARKQFGRPANGHSFAVQRPTTARELFFPELIRDDGARPRRPIAFVSAGHHLLMGVRPMEEEAVGARIVARRTYRLEPYATLTRLPLGEGVASMFGSDGLVHNAGRKEGWLLAPTGMLSAGQPRQLGTMKIRMDAYDYDDPRLLERNLRLPDDF